MVNRCDDCGNFMENREVDNLDHAQHMLNAWDRSSEASVSANSLAAIAHIQLWYAKQHRAYQRYLEDQRSQQPVAPPPPMPYSGTF